MTRHDDLRGETEAEMKLRLRAGDSLRAKFYRLKDEVFDYLVDRTTAIKSVTQSSVMQDYVLLRQGMKNLDKDPDDQEVFVACLKALRRIHLFHLRQGHTERAFPEDRPS